jgi:hypothetical protein
MSRPNTNLISTLCRINVNILQQKLDLIKILQNKHGVDQVQTQIYNHICPIVQASIGQHIRHSNDHIERVVDAVSINLFEGETILNRMKRCTIPYDTRSRNTEDEHNVAAAQQRLQRIKKVLQSYQIQSNQISIQQPVDASFILTPPPKALLTNTTTTTTTTDPTNTNEKNDLSSLLPSTIAREFGFVAHHAIHHLAMIQIIVTNPYHPTDRDYQPYLSISELPLNFGKAPSTIHHIMKQQQQQQ